MIFLKDILTVFLSSCDKYADAWLPFFRFFDMYGSSLKQHPIVIAAEKKDFSYDGLEINVLKYKKNRPWGERLIFELSQVKTEFIFFVIEDYFLLDRFNDRLFYNSLEFMKNNTDVGYLSLSNKPSDILYEYCFHEIDTNNNRLFMNTSIWRTKYLLDLLRKHESIWDFERYSYYRARNKPIKCFRLESQKACYYYEQPSSINNGKDIIGSGYGIVRGKWLTSNVELFAKYQIDVDFNHLGFYVAGNNVELNSNRKLLLKKLSYRFILVKKLDNRINKYKRNRKKKLLQKSYK